MPTVQPGSTEPFQKPGDLKLHVVHVGRAGRHATERGCHLAKKAVVLRRGPLRAAAPFALSSSVRQLHGDRPHERTLEIVHKFDRLALPVCAGQHVGNGVDRHHNGQTLVGISGSDRSLSMVVIVNILARVN